MGKIIKKQGEKLERIKMQQSLVHIKHTVTARQYKYWYLMIKMYLESVERGDLVLDERGFYFASKATFSEYLGYEPTKAELEKDFRNLRQQPIVINYLEKDGTKAMHEMGFISEFKISSKKIGFRLPSLIEAVARGEVEAKDMFLLLNWDIFNSFTGKYEAIIYKLCKDYLGVKRTPYFTIQDYRDYIGLKDNEYKQFYELNRWTISTPIKNINKNEMSDIEVEVHFEREGRKIIGLYFTMQSKTQQTLQFEELEPHPSFKFAKILISSEKQIQYLAIYTPEEVETIIERANEYTEETKSKGKKANIGAIYNKAFAEGWGLEKLEYERQQQEEENKKKQELKRKNEEKRKQEEKLKKEKEEQEKNEKEQKQKIIDEFNKLSEEERLEKIYHIFENSRMTSFFKKSFEEYGIKILEKNHFFYLEYKRIMGV